MDTSVGALLGQVVEKIPRANTIKRTHLETAAGLFQVIIQEEIV